MKKRTKGKIKGCLAIRDMYKAYKENYKGLEPLKYKEYAKIVKLCNKELIRQVVTEAETINLPYRMGTMQISRFKRSLSKSKNKMAVDWKKTKEYGFRIFFDDKYIYKWKWKKHRAIVKNKTGYKFIAMRGAKRAVPKAIRELKVEYFK